MRARASIVNKTLTNYARGFAQDRASALAKFLAPDVPTGAASGQYKDFSDKNAFQILDTARAIGGEANRVKFDASDPFFNAQPQALEIVIDDHERELAGEDEGDQLNLEQNKISTLVSTVTISHEDKVFAIIKAAKAATGGVGVWSNPANDPITEIDAQIQAIATDTGMMPNRIVIGLGAWAVIRNHPKVLARQPGAELLGLSYEQFARMLLNPQIEVRVGILSKDTAKFGAAKNAVNIVGGEVFVFIGTDNPTVYDCSFAKTFRTRRGGVDVVRQYREERSSGDVYAVHWTEDIKVVASQAGRRITLS